MRLRRFPIYEDQSGTDGKDQQNMRVLFVVESESERRPEGGPPDREGDCAENGKNRQGRLESGFAVRSTRHDVILTCWSCTGEVHKKHGFPAAYGTTTSTLLEYPLSFPLEFTAVVA